VALGLRYAAHEIHRRRTWAEHREALRTGRVPDSQRMARRHPGAVSGMSKFAATSARDCGARGLGRAASGWGGPAYAGVD